MNDDSKLLRAFLQGALNVAPLPVSTDELAAACPPKREVVEHGCPAPYLHSVEHYAVIDCVHGWHLVDRVRRGCDIYPHLRSLERAGTIQRIRVPGARSVYWSGATATTTGDVQELERLWAL